MSLLLCLPHPYSKAGGYAQVVTVYNGCMKNECEHKDCKIVGAIANTHLCHKCGGELVSNEIEIIGAFYEVGGFCDNEKCERFLVLVV